jgi:hypothetical protein
MVSAERSGTLVMIGKSLLSKTGLFMHYIATAYPDLGPAFRISSFEDLESIPLNCKILIIDNVSLKNQQVLERVKPLLRIVCKTTLRCNGEIGYLSPPVGTILLASNKSAIRSLNSTLKALDVAPVYVLNEHFEPVVTTED